MMTNGYFVSDLHWSAFVAQKLRITLSLKI